MNQGWCIPDPLCHPSFRRPLSTSQIHRLSACPSLLAGSGHIRSHVDTLSRHPALSTYPLVSGLYSTQVPKISVKSDCIPPRSVTPLSESLFCHLRLAVPTPSWALCSGHCQPPQLCFLASHLPTLASHLLCSRSRCAPHHLLRFSNPFQEPSSRLS